VRCQARSPVTWRRAGVRAREMNLNRRYFDLVALGRKTIEVRVRSPKLRKLAAGDHIRFVCGRDDAITVVKRVTRYRSFEEMLDGVGPREGQPRQPPRPATRQHPRHLWP
jgi:ASC-1-like (ASCH) protein